MMQRRMLLLRFVPSSFVLLQLAWCWLGRSCEPVVALVSLERSRSTPYTAIINGRRNRSPQVGSSSRATITRSTHPLFLAQNNQPSDAQQQAAALLERARQMRQEIAALTGTSVESLEEEATVKREQQLQQQQKAAQKMKDKANSTVATPKQSAQRSNLILPVPETSDDQLWQAKAAVERAFAAGLTRQVVRLALVDDDDDKASTTTTPSLLRNAMEESWPGGAQQMYRRAAGPMTRQLLQQLRVVAAVSSEENEQQESQSTVPSALWKQPQVTSQDVWDFDGSAVITAEHADRPASKVQALVLPNTDNKYINDIESMGQALGRERLLLLINPFWRNLDSWGFNILAPQAQANAQRVIFGAPENGGFVETYCVLPKSVRGEDCVALKAYPYDWQLYAYAETNEWPYTEYTVHLGSTPHEPTAVDFAERLSQREEFRLGKTMRQMQRRRNQ